VKRVVLSFPPAGDRAPGLVGLAWTAFAALSILVLIAAGEHRSLERHLAEIGAKERLLTEMKPHSPLADSELLRAEHLSGHANVRFADWNATFGSLGGALPPGVTAERVSLNARTGKGEAIVRMSRVADAPRVAERLNVGHPLSKSVVRRCDQSGARGEAPVRCEIELVWRRGWQ
jgi:hypothetical protein